MKNDKTRIKALAIYQIAGGIAGFGVTVWYLLDFKTFPGIWWLLLILFPFLLFSYSIYCGVLLQKNVKRGLTHSRVNQLLQVASFAMFGYAFQYVSGLYFFIGLDFTESILFKFNIGISTWQIYINTNNHDLVVNLNIIAIFLIGAIEKLLKSVRLKEMNDEISAIGKVEDIASNS